MNYKEEVVKVYPDAVYVHYDNEPYLKYQIRRTEETDDIESLGVSNISEEDAWKNAYLDSPPTPTTITVTGCGDCPMKDRDYESFLDCQHPDNFSGQEKDCPLKTSPITIMLKK